MMVLVNTKLASLGLITWCRHTRQTVCTVEYRLVIYLHGKIIIVGINRDVSSMYANRANVVFYPQLLLDYLPIK